MSDLWPHQRDFLRFAADRRSALANHPMGAGKSRSAITFLDQHHARLVVILAPKAATTIWREQFRKHSERLWRVSLGEVPRRRGDGYVRNPSIAARMGRLRAAAQFRAPVVLVVNYEASYREPMASFLLNLPADALIFDEIHKLKSVGGKQSRFAARLARGILARGGRVLGLSGTPAAQTGLDLYGVSRALGEPLAPSYRLFCKAYGQASEIWDGRMRRTIYKDVAPVALPALERATSRWMHTVRPEQLSIGMPAEIPDSFLHCDMDSATQRLYRGLERDLIADIGDGRVVTAANAMTLTTRLAQAANGCARDADSEHVFTVGTHKRELLDEVLADLAEPVIVFCRFTWDLNTVRDSAAALRRTYGELSGRRRDGLTADGRMGPQDVVGVQLQAGGTGVNLIRARVAVFFSLDWRLSDYLQARARLRRPGQTRPVLFVHLVTRGTIDEVLHKSLRNREETVDNVIRYLHRPMRDAA